MINLLEKVDIGNGPHHSTLTEHEIQVFFGLLRDTHLYNYHKRVCFHFT